MNNLMRPTTGDVFIGGKNTKDYTTAQISHEIGYVFQNPDDQIFHATVREEVAFGPRESLKLYDDGVKERTRFALESVGLWKYRNENPYNLPLSTRKFITIASILAVDTPVMIFDEPTAGQDLKGMLLLSRLIKELCDNGKTVVTITHDIDFAAENFERIVAMANKHILLEGHPSEIFYDRAVLEEAMLKAPYAVRLSEYLGLNKDKKIVKKHEFTEVFLESLNNQ